jgi:hypothetical protein
VSVRRLISGRRKAGSLPSLAQSESQSNYRAVSLEIAFLEIFHYFHRIANECRDEIKTRIAPIPDAADIEPLSTATAAGSYRRHLIGSNSLACSIPLADFVTFI